MLCYVTRAREQNSRALVEEKMKGPKIVTSCLRGMYDCVYVYMESMLLLIVPAGHSPVFRFLGL